MDADEQEARSRAHDSDGIVILLRLRSGRFAVFNNARELCGFANPEWDPLEGDDPLTSITMLWPPECWRPPATQRPTVDLKELGLD